MGPKIVWSVHLRGLVVPTFVVGLVVPATTGCAEAMPPDVIGRPPAPNAVLVEDADIGVSARPPIRRAPPELEDNDPGAVLLFHDLLAAYGAWRDDARLGLVWTPSVEAVGPAFVPYASNGRWTYRAVAGTPEWTWVSDLPWGWVTFHYGRWAYAGERGWAWIPGRRYAGAWVDWRVPESRGADAVVGWGPRPPSFVWRVSPLRRQRPGTTFDPRDMYLETVPYAAFATPYVYAPTARIFAPDLASGVLDGGSALAVAHATTPSETPSAERLGHDGAQVPGPPALDRGLQQAWMLATPGTAAAVGAGPELPSAPRLRTWVVGGPRWATR